MNNNQFFIEQELKKQTSRINQIQSGANAAKTIRDCARMCMDLNSSGGPIVGFMPQIKNAKFQAARKIERSAELILTAKMESIKNSINNQDFDLNKARSDFHINFIEPCRGYLPTLHRTGSKFLCGLTSTQEIPKGNKAVLSLR